MKIHELAKSYHFTKEKRDEKNRVINYEHPRKLKDLEGKAYDVDSKLRMVSFKNDIKNDEEILKQYDAELKEIYAELNPMLEQVGANTDDRLEVHLHEEIYLSAYLSEEGEIITSSYHKVS